MGRMSKIRVAFDAKDDLKDDSSRQRRVEGRSAKTTSTSTHSDDFKLKYTQNHDTNSSNSRPFLEKKRLFVNFFRSKIWNSRNFSIHLQHRKTFDKLIRLHIYDIHPHKQSSVFRKLRDIYNQRASSNDRRRETKDWNIQRNRYGHQSRKA